MHQNRPESPLFSAGDSGTPAQRARTVPAFAPARGGDDLELARRFVDGAVDAMRTLRADETDEVHLWLDSVERSAGELQARAIARAVREARRDIGSPRILDSIGTVGCLIAQYEQGLVDVEVQIEAGERVVEPEPLAPRPARARTTDERYAEVRETLERLLPQVDAEPHGQALRKLMDYTPPEPAAAQAQDKAEAPPATSGTAARGFDVEALLPGLVDHASRTARARGKTLTASYAAREATVAPSLAGEWQKAVELAVEALVETTLETAETRRARGETGAAHMALTAEGMGDALELRIRCPGRNVPRFAVDAPHSIEASAHDGQVVVVFTTRPEGRAA